VIRAPARALWHSSVLQIKATIGRPIVVRVHMPELTSQPHSPEHPDAREAFICEHLLLNPTQVWCSARPHADAPVPGRLVPKVR